MAYCRMGDGCDVYLYRSCDERGDIYVFNLPYNRPFEWGEEKQTTYVMRPASAAAQLAYALQRAGYGIPDEAIARILKDMPG